MIYKRIRFYLVQAQGISLMCQGREKISSDLLQPPIISCILRKERKSVLITSKTNKYHFLNTKGCPFGHSFVITNLILISDQNILGVYYSQINFISSLTALIVPPSISVNCLAIASPSPVLPFVREISVV